MFDSMFNTSGIQPDPENPDPAYRARMQMLAKLIAQQSPRN